LNLCRSFQVDFWMGSNRPRAGGYSAKPLFSNIEKRAFGMI
jgi:hypothetical protein